MKHDPLKEPLGAVTLYNPDLLNDEEFKAYFVARMALLKRLARELKQEEVEGVGRHRLIVAQRGMGKTSLLRRIALAVEEDDTLHGRWLPLRFPEEQWDLKSLGELWLNCLDALGDYLERHNDFAGADRVDGRVEALRPLREPELADAALNALCDACAETGRRPLLLIDNMDLIFDRLSKDEHWGLRKALSEPGAPLLYAASSRPIENTYKYDEAFYDYFLIHELKPLKLEEMEEVLATLAERFQRPELQALLKRERWRVATLHQLTGGNPRTTLMLFSLLSQGVVGDVRNDVERLLDGVTPLYKARIEELPPQGQQVLHAVASAWDPVPVARLAEELRMNANQVSVQLGRLHDQGLLEKVKLPKTKKQGYQIAERFFNIWFLMRQSRRMRRRLVWLTRFLQAFYTQDQLHEFGRDHLSLRPSGDEQALASHAETLFAISDAVEEPGLSGALRHAAGDALYRSFDETRRSLEEMFELSGVAPEEINDPQKMVWELREQFKVIQKARGDEIPEDLWELLIGSPTTHLAGKKKLIGVLETLPVEQVEGLTDVFRKEYEEWLLSSRDEVLTKALWRALGEGVIESVADVRRLESAVHFLNEPGLAAMALGAAVVGGWLNAEDVRGRILLSAEQSKKSCVYGILADVNEQAGYYEEAEGALRRIIELDGGDAGVWNDLGCLLANRFGRYEEAELAFQRSIELDKSFSSPWHNLGNLFSLNLERYEEAEFAYRQSIEIDECSGISWDGLGNLLQEYFGRYEEAELAHRRAIELDELDSAPWTNLGNLLQDYLGRYGEAELAYRKAIDLDGSSAMPWSGLGNLLQDHLERFEEAESAYLQAIKLDETNSHAWSGLGRLLHEKLGRYEDAESAYLHAIELNGDDPLPYFGVSLLRLDFLHDLEGAREASERLQLLMPNKPFVLLHQAAVALAYDNWGDVQSVLGEVLPLELDDMGLDYLIGAYGLFGRIARSRYLSDAIELLDLLGIGEQWRPLREALAAVESGSKEYLLGIAPEVRGVAERLYDQFTAEACSSGDVKGG